MDPEEPARGRRRHADGAPSLRPGRSGRPSEAEQRPSATRENRPDSLEHGSLGAWFESLTRGSEPTILAATSPSSILVRLRMHPSDAIPRGPSTPHGGRTGDETSRLQTVAPAHPDGL